MKTTSKTSLIATLAVAGAFTAGFLTGPASAQDQIYRGPFEFEFRYDAAELGNVQSAEKLVTRLEAVVSAYCGERPTMSPEEKFTTSKCVKRTMRASIDKFENSMVAQAFQSRADG